LELVAPGAVNTMPAPTLHGVIRGSTIRGSDAYLCPAVPPAMDHRLGRVPSSDAPAWAYGPNYRRVSRCRVIRDGDCARLARVSARSALLHRATWMVTCRVIQFDQVRTNTTVTIAAERLALIAVPADHGVVVGLRDRASSSNDRSNCAPGVVLAVMVVISTILLRWAKRQGW
jgi:hypothetical protein